MQSDCLRLLVLADPHYTGVARHACPLAKRHAPLARILVRKALAQLSDEGTRPDAIVLLGDLVDDGDAPDARADLTALAGELLRIGIPVYAVAGNHDAAGTSVAQAFGTPPGLHRLGRYGLLLFQDHRLEGDVFVRDASQLALPETEASRDPSLILIALQHHPLHPRIESSYPYMLANGDAVLASYRRAKVALSLSGHYHAGQPAHAVDGTLYATAPALAEPPYRFLDVRLEGRHAFVQERSLRVDSPGLWDIHCHTEFAYCATTVEAATATLLAKHLGLAGLGVVEHAFQLYFPAPYAWSYRWQREHTLVEDAYRDAPHTRMAAYRRFARELRQDPFVRIGLEVDLLDDGRILLAPGDADGWDYLIGAIHAVDGCATPESQAKAESLFMRDLDRLLAHPVAVLAHPFRFFERAGLAKPEHLYAEVADRLAARGVAAEVNVHINEPEPAFFRACVNRGVKIALGTDSHSIAEVGALARHLRFLRDIGLDEGRFAEALYRPA